MRVFEANSVKATKDIDGGLSSVTQMSLTKSVGYQKDFLEELIDKVSCARRARAARLIVLLETVNLQQAYLLTADIGLSNRLQGRNDLPLKYLCQ
jgi:hypothetical protein